MLYLFSAHLVIFCVFAVAYILSDAFHHNFTESSVALKYHSMDQMQRNIVMVCHITGGGIGAPPQMNQGGRGAPPGMGPPPGQGPPVCLIFGTVFAMHLLVLCGVFVFSCVLTSVRTYASACLPVCVFFLLLVDFTHKKFTHTSVPGQVDWNTR